MVNILNSKGRELSFEKPVVMGILNVTPDSFSDGGKYYGAESREEKVESRESPALARAVEMIKEGATIIDIGGESTGPGSKEVTEEEELRRVIPVIKGLREKDPNIWISIDTYKSNVAREAIRAGADIVNDVTALRGDPEMAHTLAVFDVPVVLMYSKDETPRTTLNNIQYDDVFETILGFLEERIDYAVSQGIKRENIIIDPGMGAFISSDPRYSFEILERLREFKVFNLPILIGASRKSFLAGRAELPPNERLEASLEAAKFAVENGANILRVHDVKETIDFLA